MVEVGRAVTGEVKQLDQRLAKLEQQLVAVTQGVDALTHVASGASRRPAAAVSVTAGARRKAAPERIGSRTCSPAFGSAPGSVRQSFAGSARPSMGGGSVRASLATSSLPTGTGAVGVTASGDEGGVAGAVGEVRAAQTAFERKMQSQMDEVKQLLRSVASQAIPPAGRLPVPVQRQEAQRQDAELQRTRAQLDEVLGLLRAQQGGAQQEGAQQALASQVPRDGEGSGAPSVTRSESAPMQKSEGRLGDAFWTAFKKT